MAVETGVQPMTMTSALNDVCISFHDLSYTVNFSTRCTTISKPILKSLNGVIKPGVNAIMGPTGSGKSSLLDALAGRKDPRFLSGHILINGHEQPRNFKCMAGYVVQDDVVMGTLTVRENIQFSANLRLSEECSFNDKQAKVSQVISELGLANCADTKVGTPLLRGVSGGERKRTSIGMELIVSPNVLFLDEPTTGLDSSTANSVIELLHRLARQGRTIVLSIHQPRYSIYKMFDTITLLDLGRMIYAGPTNEAITYFDNLGYVCEEHDNPSDFFLDVISGDSSLPPSDFRSSQPCSRSKSGSIYSQPEYDDEEVSQNFSAIFLKSSLYLSIKEEADKILNDYELRMKDKTEVQLLIVEYPTSFSHQLLIVGRRTISNLIRDPQSSLIQFIFMVVFALIIGGLFFHLKTDSHGVSNRRGACYFLIMHMVFTNISAVELFIAERPIFFHENSSGFYKTPVYFLSKLLCDILPVRILPGLIFCTIVYWMIGFQTFAGHYFVFTMALLSVSVSGSAIAFLVSSAVSVFSIANILVALVYLIMLVFSGLFINLTSLPQWISWLKYFSIFRYSFAIIAINELKDLEFCDTRATPAICKTLGNDYLKDHGIPFHTTWDLYSNFFGLWLISTLVLILSFIAIMKINRFK